jgi:hypothetical protein
MFRYDACAVLMPNKAGTVKQHNEGKRHASVRFYGDADAGPVRRIEFRSPDGELIRSLRPYEVADSAAAASRAARELVRRKLLVHTGVAWQNKVWTMLNPEALCCAVLQLDSALHGQPESAEGGPSHRGMIEGKCEVSAHFLLAVAERLGRGAGPACFGVHPCVGKQANSCENGHGEPPGSEATVRGSHEVTLALADRGGTLAEMCIVVALDALFCALGSQQPHRRRGSAPSVGAGNPLALTIRVGAAVRERRHAAELTKSLCSVLALPSAPLLLRSLHLHASGPAWRAEDAHVIVGASASRWRACATSILLGTHSRAGAVSPFRRLPSVLVRIILDTARPGCTTEVVVELADEPPAAVSSNATSLGADLAFIASLC